MACHQVSATTATMESLTRTALRTPGIVAMLGMGQTYVVVAALYLISFALTFGIREPSQDAGARKT